MSWSIISCSLVEKEGEAEGGKALVVVSLPEVEAAAWEVVAVVSVSVTGWSGVEVAAVVLGLGVTNPGRTLRMELRMPIVRLFFGEWGYWR
jgi:hypothetical protein